MVYNSLFNIHPTSAVFSVLPEFSTSNEEYRNETYDPDDATLPAPLCDLCTTYPRVRTGLPFISFHGSYPHFLVLFLNLGYTHGKPEQDDGMVPFGFLPYKLIF